MAKKAVKRTAVAVPQSTGEAAKLVAEIGRRQRDIARVQTEVNDEIEKIKAAALKKTGPHEERIKDLMERVYIFAEGHRAKLTKGGKTKTVRLPTGVFFWRTNPPSASIQGAEKVVELCEKLDLTRFIRITKVPDKIAMLKEQDVAAELKGVTIVQKEEFGVKPSETNLEISQDTEKLKKVLPE